MRLPGEPRAAATAVLELGQRLAQGRIGAEMLLGIVAGSDDLPLRELVESVPGA